MTEIKIFFSAEELDILHKSILLNLARIDDWEFPSLIGANKNDIVVLEKKIQDWMNIAHGRTIHTIVSETEMRWLHSCVGTTILGRGELTYKRIMGCSDISEVLTKLNDILERENIDL